MITYGYGKLLTYELTKVYEIACSISRVLDHFN